MKDAQHFKLWRSISREVAMGHLFPLKASEADEVSFEIGACFQPVPNGLHLTPAEEQVFACLHFNRMYIVEAENKFRVSRVAIAGAIAWEMLENARSFSPRSAGYGKIHLYNYSKKKAAGGAMTGAAAGPLGMIIGAVVNVVDKDTAAAQAEERGYLPSRTYDERKLQLSMPRGAIKYIGAIMAGIADIAEQQGFEDIRNDPEILTNVYQSMDLNAWEKHLHDKPKGAKLHGGNTMDIWVKKRMSFLTAAVGNAQIAQSEIPSIGHDADKDVKVFSNLTLSDLAQSEYGDWRLWPLLYDKNRKVIGNNPNQLRPGSVLAVPPLGRFNPTELADARRRAPSWKKPEVNKRPRR